MVRKEKVGIVVSDKMAKTRIVAVRNRIKHKLYGKVITKTKRYSVRDTHNISNLGDLVRISETRPISKTVNWLVTEILKTSST